MADEKSIPLRVASYAWVSTRGKGQDTEVQLRDLREHVSRRGWQLSGEYVDAGISGPKERRPQLDRLSPMLTGAALTPSRSGNSIDLPAQFHISCTPSKTAGRVQSRDHVRIHRV